MAGKQVDFDDAQKPPKLLEPVLLALAVACIVIVVVVKNL